MTSWVYIFSRFTPEALLLEALVIFFLICAYTAFWVLRKRRYGPVDSNLPSGPVKSYLNELILNAEHLRLQLFGLLSSSEYPKNTGSNLSTQVSLSPGGQVTSQDPEMAKKLAQLEFKLMEQTKSLELISAEKTKLEKELTEAKENTTAGSTGSGATADSTGSPGGNSEEISKLQQKIQDLESRLAEYNVIEDDLANLKRLQQENVQLKAQLSGKPSQAQAPQAPPPDKPVEADPAILAAAAASEPSADVFEGLVGSVDSSLQPPPEATPAASSTNETNNAEADLVAEFEKMLKG
jgi:hypothetical protein